MNLTLGPILFEWKRDDVARFYDEAAAWPVDTVYIGEVVCYKKRGLTVKDMAAIGAKLTEAGKKVVISTLAVVSNEDELALTRAMLSLPFAIEANDMSVFNMIEEGKEVYAGPHIKTYNRGAMEFLIENGVKHVTFPVELPAKAIKENIEGADAESEVFAYGKAPLAFSWRCYTERAHGLTKDKCQHHCIDHPDGMQIKTMDGEDVFNINGTSVLSAAPVSLIEQTDELKAMGVGALRISPQYKDTGAIIKVYKEHMDGTIDSNEASARLNTITGTESVNGWYYGKAGKDNICTQTAHV